MKQSALDLKYQNLKRRFRAANKRDEELKKQIAILSSKRPKLWELEREISKVSHKYERNDVVLLKDKNIASIDRCLGRKHYKVFIPCSVFKSNVGYSKKIHEREILCHAMDLVLTGAEMKFKPHGWRTGVEE